MKKRLNLIARLSMGSGLVALLLLAIVVSALRVSATPTINEYPTLTSSSLPEGIATGPDGKVWFTELVGNKIGKVTTNGTVTEYSIPTSSSAPVSIVAGPDGNMWFTEYSGNKIGKVTTSGSFTEYTVPTSTSQPNSITAGPDGNLWFAERSTNKIGKVTTSGSFTEYTVPTSSSQPSTLTAGPDGNLWFTEYAGNKVGKVTTSGSFTEYAIPTSAAHVYGIVTGPDNNLWFVENGTNKVGYVTTSGSVTEYVIPTSNSQPYGLTVGPDSNIWFTEGNTNKIGLVTTAGVFTEYTVPTSSSSPYTITLGPDNNIWFLELTGSKIGQVVVPAPPANNSTVPNNGDANGDGTPDSQQANINGIINPVTGSYALVQSSCTSVSSMTINAESATKADSGFDYPAGLMNFTALSCGTPGATGTFTQYYYGSGLDASKVVPRKFNSTTGTYTTIPGAAVTNVTIGGKSVLKIVYQITDGGPFDQDGSANGTIVDPAGPGITVSAPATGFSITSNIPQILAIFTLSSGTLFALAITFRKKLNR